MLIGIDARSLQERGIGVGRYLYNLIRFYPELDTTNQYQLYFSGEQKIDVPADFKKKNLKLPLLNHNIIWMNCRLPLELAMHKVDLFHCPFYGLPFIQPVPMVVTIHDIIYEVHPEWYPVQTAASFRYLSRHASHTARKIIADSEYTKKDILERYQVSEGRVEVIYLAAESTFCPLNDPDILQRVQNKFNIIKPFILHVGAIHERRNVDRLLRAFTLVREKGYDIQLVLSGKEAHGVRTIRQRIEELGISQEVTMIDYVSDEDLVALYNAAKVFVYPSLYEGFGLPLVEAMACGTPVAAANATCIPEVVGAATLLFDPYSIEDIADKTMKILNNKQLSEELSKKGILRAQSFSWKKAAQQTINVYNQALGG